MSTLIARAKQIAGPRVTTRLRCLLRGYDLPRWGNLRRTKPFSETFGFERGTPVDRYYLHRFLHDHRALIKGYGNCLSAVAAQLGLALEELSETELAVHDPRYPVLTTIVCRKPR